MLEWELLEHPAGAAYLKASLGSKMPPFVAPLLFAMFRSHLHKQLYARGIARHAPEIIEAMGRSDVGALADFLENRSFLLTERPSTADAAVFGLLAPMAYWPMPTPVASYVKSIPAITGYCDRLRQRCFAGKRTRTA